ncbi:hypothetical protein SCOR_03070 [Sulfidibacter corallicola]|uniref:Uncharacterized protein n=1 Tax=Sulfidibacter corallicola TaxID=2818388 RepID=A0A8A4TG06_SULCO|nr:hypothetical protein [Sulfidibacter corallicola]QTD48490.1 hypothetical protein J3U87_23165 [Sulfidibacter corallicola]
MDIVVPGISGFIGVLVMTLFLRRARFLHLPESQMVRAIGSMITKNYDTSLIPGTIVHFTVGTFFGYVYWFLLQTAPEQQHWHTMVYVAACGMMGLVHGLVVTLFLVIAVAQYHPVERFQKLTPNDMVSHVIAHLAYGITVGFFLSSLPGMLG